MLAQGRNVSTTRDEAGRQAGQYKTPLTQSLPAPFPLTYHSNGPHGPPLKGILLGRLPAEDLLLEVAELLAHGRLRIQTRHERARVLVCPTALHLVRLGEVDGVPVRERGEEQRRGQRQDRQTGRRLGVERLHEEVHDGERVICI